MCWYLSIIKMKINSCNKLQFTNNLWYFYYGSNSFSILLKRTLSAYVSYVLTVYYLLIFMFMTCLFVSLRVPKKFQDKSLYSTQQKLAAKCTSLRNFCQVSCFIYLFRLLTSSALTRQQLQVSNIFMYKHVRMYLIQINKIYTVMV